MSDLIPISYRPTFEELDAQQRALVDELLKIFQPIIDKYNYNIEDDTILNDLTYKNLKPFIIDQYTVLRYLRQHDFNLELAKNALKKTVIWRQKYNIDTLLDSPPQFLLNALEEYNKLFPNSFLDRDMYGRPLYYSLIGKVQVNNINAYCCPEKAELCHIWDMEKKMRMCRDWSRQPEHIHIDTYVNVLDLMIGG